MSYKLMIIQKPSYLHAVVTGKNSKENVSQYLEELHNECLIRKCRRILVEERLEGPRLGIIDTFQIIEKESSRHPRYFEAIAYIDQNTRGDNMKFAETVAINRAMPVKVFSSVQDAEQWLLDGAGTKHQ